MRAKKLLTSRQIFRYAVPARTVTKSTRFKCGGASHGRSATAELFVNPVFCFFISFVFLVFFSFFLCGQLFCYFSTRRYLFSSLHFLVSFSSPRLLPFFPVTFRLFYFPPLVSVSFPFFLLKATAMLPVFGGLATS